ncbi:MAG TPA: non-ribosomal peptide synthetase, partial [Candidatus Tenderia sp.]|nr:non-ribosomal peptide synthetase [Candidatus Tenderia sp.]
SWRILKDDLQLALTQLAADQALALPGRTCRYQDWGQALQDYAKTDALAEEADYWLTQVTQPAVVFPEAEVTNPEAVDNTLASTAVVSKVWDQAHTAQLLAEANGCYHTQINDLLLTALMLTLNDFQDESGHSAVRFDVEGHGREDELSGLDSSETIGWFTSLYPVCLRPAGGDDLSQQIPAVKEQLRAIPNKGMGFGVLRYLGNDERFQAVPAHSAVVFNYLGQFDTDVSSTPAVGLVWSNEPRGCDVSAVRQRSHQLGINGLVTDGRLQFSFDYNRHLYRAAAIEAIAARYFEWLERIVEHCRQAEGRYTPSDFPLAGVSGSRLAGLQQAYALEDLYPGTPMQQGLLLETRLSARGGAYMTQLQFVFKAVDADALQQAWQQVVQRHAIFRTVFVEGDTGELLQLVQPQVTLAWESLDWQGLDAVQQSARLVERLSMQRHQLFDAAKGPLMRFLLIKENSSRQRLVWTHHHALLDGWSLPLVMSELFQRYGYLVGERAELVLPELVPYRHYIAWLQSQKVSEQEAYWREYLAGCEVTPLPSGPLQAEGDGHAAVELHLPQALTTALTQLAKQAQVTLNTLFQGAWGLLLSRYGNCHEAVFGVTRSGRPAELAGSEQMVGLFITTQPLRVHIPRGKQSVIRWLQDLHHSQLEQEAYSAASLSDVQRWGGKGFNEPLFESILVFENRPAEMQQSSLPLEAIEGEEELHYPLGLVVIPGERLGCRLMYQQSRLDGATVERLGEHLQRLLEGMVADGAQAVNQLTMV